MVSALDSGSSGPGSSSPKTQGIMGHVQEANGKTLYSHSASLSTQMLGSGNAAIIKISCFNALMLLVSSCYRNLDKLLLYGHIYVFNP